MRTYLLILLSVIFLTSCENKPTTSIEGLWVVTTVKAGKNEMTPNARWVRFNADATQQSGNGWFQHSIGTWKLNQETNELAIVNSNGLHDSAEPFQIQINQNTMTWNRVEEGQAIEVHLKRTQQLPTTHGDQLLGLWKLDKASGTGDYFPITEKSKTSLFFRWDKRFDIRTENGRIRGVYNVHGHKSEVQFIPYNEELKRSFWSVQFKENVITLKLLNSDSLVTRTFKRIHEFPK